MKKMKIIPDLYFFMNIFIFFILSSIFFMPEKQRNIAVFILSSLNSLNSLNSCHSAFKKIILKQGRGADVLHLTG